MCIFGGWRVEWIAWWVDGVWLCLWRLGVVGLGRAIAMAV